MKQNTDVATNEGNSFKPTKNLSHIILIPVNGSKHWRLGQFLISKVIQSADLRSAQRRRCFFIRSIMDSWVLFSFLISIWRKPKLINEKTKQKPVVMNPLVLIDFFFFFKLRAELNWMLPTWQLFNLSYTLTLNKDNYSLHISWNLPILSRLK